MVKGNNIKTHIYIVHQGGPSKSVDRKQQSNSSL